MEQFLNSFSQGIQVFSQNRTLSVLRGDFSEVSFKCSEATVCHLIETHCGNNPFEAKAPLKSLVSSTLVADKEKDGILHFADKGQKHYEAFVSECLIFTSKGSVWDKMKKLNLKTFSNWIKDF